jgi:hypothetical protein
MERSQCKYHSHHRTASLDRLVEHSVTMPLCRQMTRTTHGRDTLAYVIAFSAFAMAALCITSPFASADSLPATHEGLRYYHLTAHFSDSLLHGHVYPRWLPNAFGGYGYPLFVFYQPASFYVLTALSWITGSVFIGTWITLALCITTGAFGCFLIGATLSDKTTGCFAAMLFFTTPYVYINMNVRGDISELQAMCVFPWCLYSLLKMLPATGVPASVNRMIATFALCTAALVLSHPATALFGGATLLLTGVGLSYLSRTPMASLCALALGMSVALCLSSCYWCHLFVLKDYVAHAGAIEGNYSSGSHVVYVSQWFKRDWGFGGSVQGPGDSMSFQLGLPHFLLAVCGLLLAKGERWSVIIGASYVVLLILMTPACSSVWDRCTLLRYVQFPWRIMSVTTTLQAVCGMLTVRCLVAERLRWHFISTCALCCTVWYWGYMSPNSLRLDNVGDTVALHKQTYLHAFHSYTCVDEFTPRTARGIVLIGPRHGRDLAESNAGRQLTPAPDSTPHRLHYHIDAGPPGYLTLNQLYFPGWTAYLDGELLDDSLLRSWRAADGRLRVEIHDSDCHELTACYRGPPLSWATTGLTGGAVVGLLGLYVTGCCFTVTAGAHRRALLEHTECLGTVFRTDAGSGVSSSEQRASGLGDVRRDTSFAWLNGVIRSHLSCRMICRVARHSLVHWAVRQGNNG